MAHYTDSIGFYKNSPAFLAQNNNRTTLVTAELDFAKIAAERAAAGATALGIGDSLDVLVAPAGSYVVAGGLEVLTAGTASLTLDLGIEGIAAHFLDGVAGDAEGGFGSASTAMVYFDDETPVRLTGGVAAPGNLKVRVWLLVCDTKGELGDVPGTV